MSKLYYDKFFDHSCIVSKNRKERPHIEDDVSTCPFCMGNESYIENIWVEEKDDKGNFLVRIINNKYPICSKVGELYGIHDVVIDTPDHFENPEDFSIDHWYKILLCIKKRCQTILLDENIKFVQVFKNYGKRAGASIKHSHWQIVALSEIPYTMIKHYDSYNKNSTKTCYICDQIENAKESYIIYENDHWVNIVPKISNYQQETWLVPKKHKRNYQQLEDRELISLASLFKSILTAYSTLIPDMHYNICFISAPKDQNIDYHFLIKIIPRCTTIAGFEIATGCYINVVEPADYAQDLRKLLIKNEGS